MTVIQTDARGRVTLPGGKARRRYLANEMPDGTIVLEPAVVVSELEHRYLTSGVASQVALARANPDQRSGRPARRTS